MKKTIVILLVVILVAGGLGGFAYAQTHGTTGKKLIGVGQLGKKTTLTDGEAHFVSAFYFTNPDCSDNITINQIAIIKGDGRVIYEGSMRKLIRDAAGEVTGAPAITRDMAPHEIWRIKLHLFMKDPDAADPNRWLTPEEAKSLDAAPYTLEIFWTGSGLPLTGWASTQRTVNLPGKKPITGFARTRMVNMNQQ